MSFEENYNWIYTFLIIPMVIMAQKHFSLSSRVAVVESTQNLKLKDVKELQKCMKDLSGKVENLSGQIEEHFRKNSD